MTVGWTPMRQDGRAANMLAAEHRTSAARLRARGPAWEALAKSHENLAALEERSTAARSTGGKGAAWERIEKAATDLQVTERSLTHEQAIDRVTCEQPELAAAWRDAPDDPVPVARAASAPPPPGKELADALDELARSTARDRGTSLDMAYQHVLSTPQGQQLRDKYRTAVNAAAANGR
jgi:hypothetical protein